MKVSQASLYRTLQYNLERSSKNMNELYLQGSTGKKVLDASDDPSAIGSIFSSRTEIATADRYLETIADTQDGIDIVDGYLNSAEDILVRVKEIAVTAVNGALSPTDLETYADEMGILQSSLLDIANAKVDGKYIFSGYAETTPAFSGTPPTYTGTGDHKMVEVSRGQTVQTSLTGEEVFSSPLDCFAMMSDLEANLRSGDTTAISTSLDDLEMAADQIRSKRSGMGNINERLEDTTALLQNVQLQMKGRLSGYEDADLIEVMTGVTQAEQAYQAALSVSARLATLSILDYL